MSAEYGPFFLCYWTGLWACSGVCLYMGLEYTTIVDSAYLLEKLHLQDKVSPSAGTVGVAVVINEALEVVRFPFTLATTKSASNLWRRIVPRKAGANV